MQNLGRHLVKTSCQNSLNRTPSSFPSNLFNLSLQKTHEYSSEFSPSKPILFNTKSYSRCFSLTLSLSPSHTHSLSHSLLHTLSFTHALSHSHSLIHTLFLSLSPHTLFLTRTLTLHTHTTLSHSLSLLLYTSTRKIFCSIFCN